MERETPAFRPAPPVETRFGSQLPANIVCFGKPRVKLADEGQGSRTKDEDKGQTRKDKSEAAVGPSPSVLLSVHFRDPFAEDEAAFSVISTVGRNLDPRADAGPYAK
jgi:hypothetical protein